MPESKISIVIPVLNDLTALKNLLPALQSCRRDGHEILVVDGGSVDGSVTYASAHADRILMTGTGRGRQMNLGAENARHEILLFLHADSRFPERGIARIQAALSRPGKHWGRFNVRLDAPGIVFSVIATLMNLRSRVTGVATGDQGIFVRRKVFHDVGGFEVIPLMEDIALSKALRHRAWPVCLREPITTSARRWRERGIARTILEMWYLRLAYFLGRNPNELAALYYPADDRGRKDRKRDG